MSGLSNTIESSCHCGNIKLRMHTKKNEHELTPRTCQCDFCQSHGANWISDPDGEIRIRFEDSDKVNYYRFGHKTSDFIVCNNCGVVTIALCELDGQNHAVINITAIRKHKFPAPPVQTEFDAESVEDRLERRGKNWTGNVVFED